DNNVLRLWDTEGWEQRWHYDIGKRYGDNYITHTPFSPDSRLLALYGKVPDPEQPGQLLPEATVLEVATGKEVARLPGRGSRYFFCPDGTGVVTRRNDTVTLWDLPTCRKRFDLKAAGPLCKYAEPTFSKDGALLFMATTAGRGHLWETATGKERAVVEGYVAAFAPDGQALATQLSGAVVKLWDTA